MKITVIKGMDNVSIGGSWIPDCGFIHCRTLSQSFNSENRFDRGLFGYE